METCVAAVVAVVSDACLDVRCVWSQRHGDATTVTDHLCDELT